MKSKILSILLAFFLSTNAFAGVTFDETDDRIDLGTTGLPTQASAITLFAVFELGDLSGNKTIVGDWNGNCVIGCNWLMNFEDAATDLLYVGKGNGGGGYNRITFSSPSSGVVYRMAAGLIADGSTACRGNLNGTTSTTCTFWFNSNAGTSQDPNIGDLNGGGAGNPFKGNIYTVCIWSSLLTAAEMSQLVTSQTKNVCSQISPSTLEGEYYLDDQPDGTSGDGDTFRDRSENINNGVGNDGANNTGLTMIAEKVSTYP